MFAKVLFESECIDMSQLAEIIRPSPSVAIAVDSAVLAVVLAPYKLQCRYLSSVVAEYGQKGYSLPSARGEFSIPESCYIASTGHFNAVEFNICYNQLAYSLMGHIVQNQWLDVLAGWDLAEFGRRQLSSCLIVGFFSSFRKPLNAHLFEGKVDLEKVSLRKGTIFMKTTCSFQDSYGSTAEGGALIAIVGEAMAGNA
jgi:hypothetical protein